MGYAEGGVGVWEWVFWVEGVGGEEKRYGEVLDWMMGYDDDLDGNAWIWTTYVDVDVDVDDIYGDESKQASAYLFFKLILLSFSGFGLGTPAFLTFAAFFFLLLIFLSSF